MPLDVPTPTAPAIIAEARARGYTMALFSDGYGIYYPDAPRPDDDIEFWWRLRAVPKEDIIAALEAERLAA